VEKTDASKRSEIDPAGKKPILKHGHSKKKDWGGEVTSDAGRPRGWKLRAANQKEGENEMFKSTASKKESSDGCGARSLLRGR